MRGVVILAALVGVLAGTSVGIGSYTFFYAKGASYMTNDPRACANCHVMNQQFDGWVKSSHRNVAVCNDCHAPHDLIGKYTTKAVNGFFHSYAFTTGDFPETIRIRERNRVVTEGACRSCHSDLVAQLDGPHRADSPQLCLHCHPGVGHLEAASVGTTPSNIAGDTR